MIVRESMAYGEDEFEGLLHVTSIEAYFEVDGTRIRLIQAPPQTAVAAEVLLAEAAALLRGFDGQRIRAQGDLQGDILWDADVTGNE